MEKPDVLKPYYRLLITGDLNLYGYENKTFDLGVGKHETL